MLGFSQTARDRLKDDPQLREVWGTLAGLSVKYLLGPTPPHPVHLTAACCTVIHCVSSCK